METVSKALLSIHIFAGAVSLILFWLPIFTRKGGKAHRQIGKIYVLLMWIVVVTSAILSIKNVIIGYYEPAAFLGFIAIITASPLWYGIAALKQKRGVSANYIRTHLIFAWAQLVFGILLIIYGLQIEGMGVLMLIFGILGSVNGGQALRSYYQQKKLEVDGYELHFSGMIISGIAAYTAFAAFGGRQFFSDILTGYWMVLPWVLPTIIGVAIIEYMKRQRLV